jgi:mannose-6-phosphate isomerase-like protein (cupin superfamily)
MSEILVDQPAPDGKYMIDSYGDWAKAENVPIVTAPAVDLLSAAVAPWPRFGTRGAIFHLNGRGDFLTLFLFELAAGEKSAPQRHMYEEVFFVLSGQGATVIETSDGGSRRQEWKPHSLFTVPMNARHYHVNESREPARLASVNDLRYFFNVFRNESFVFANAADFPERASGTDQRDGTHLETGQVVDLDGTIVGGSLDMTLAQGSIGAALHEIPPGASQDGPHRETGCFLFGVNGAIKLQGGGTALDLRPGVVTASLPDAAYQLSNAGTHPARLLAVRMGSARYPLLRTKRNT